MLSEKESKVIVIYIKTNYPQKYKRFSETVKNAHFSLKTTFCGSPV